MDRREPYIFKQPVYRAVTARWTNSILNQHITLTVPKHAVHVVTFVKTTEGTHTITLDPWGNSTHKHQRWTDSYLPNRVTSRKIKHYQKEMAEKSKKVRKAWNFKGIQCFNCQGNHIRSKCPLLKKSDGKTSYGAFAARAKANLENLNMYPQSPDEEEILTAEDSDASSVTTLDSTPPDSPVQAEISSDISEDDEGNGTATDLSSDESEEKEVFKELETLKPNNSPLGKPKTAELSTIYPEKAKYLDSPDTHRVMFTRQKKTANKLPESEKPKVEEPITGAMSTSPIPMEMEASTSSMGMPTADPPNTPTVSQSPWNLDDDLVKQTTQVLAPQTVSLPLANLPFGMAARRGFKLKIDLEPTSKTIITTARMIRVKQRMAVLTKEEKTRFAEALLPRLTQDEIKVLYEIMAEEFLKN